MPNILGTLLIATSLLWYGNSQSGSPSFSSATKSSSYQEYVDKLNENLTLCKNNTSALNVRMGMLNNTLTVCTQNLTKSNIDLEKCKNMLNDITQVYKINIHMYGNVLNMNLADEKGKDGVLMLTDSATPTWQKKKLTICGDNRKFKGVIITPPSIDEVVFCKNSFVKNTISISGKQLKFIQKSNTNNNGRLRGRPNNKMKGNITELIPENENEIKNETNIVLENKTYENNNYKQNLEGNNSTLMTNDSLEMKSGIIKLHLEDENTIPADTERRNIIINTLCAVFPKIPLICNRK